MIEGNIIHVVTRVGKADRAMLAVLRLVRKDGIDDGRSEKVVQDQRASSEQSPCKMHQRLISELDAYQQPRKRRHSYVSQRLVPRNPARELHRHCKIVWKSD